MKVGQRLVGPDPAGGCVSWGACEFTVTQVADDGAPTVRADAVHSYWGGGYRNDGLAVGCEYTLRAQHTGWCFDSGRLPWFTFYEDGRVICA